VPSDPYISEEDNIEGFSSSARDGSLPKTPRLSAMRKTTKAAQPINKLFQKILTALDITG
jgi:hypothetical protein